MSYSLHLLAFILFAFSWLVISVCKKKVGYPLLPGPPAELFLGHSRLIPSERQDIAFYKLSKKYGEGTNLDA
jgi:hypothetical protein